jgi:hypothetical protein
VPEVLRELPALIFVVNWQILEFVAERDAVQVSDTTKLNERKMLAQ